jgi:hypothetical protein
METMKESDWCFHSPPTAKAGSQPSVMDAGVVRKEKEHWPAQRAAVFEADLLDLLAVCYLALPITIFFCGWLRGPVAVLGCLALAALLVSLACERRTGALDALSWRWVVATGVVAVVWASMGGAGHFFYANAFDWRIRDAVLRDLTVFPWPVNYGRFPGGEYVLRAPLGYFLPAALLGKFIGLVWADRLLFLWTAAGLGLFICLMLRLFPSRAGKCLWLIWLPWFSGADVIGWVLSGKGGFGLGQHLEWWANSWQYSSVTTLLFWVPNHALPGWLAGGLLLKHWQRPTAFWVFAFLLSVTPLWSPLVTIGVAPFALAWLIMALREPAKRLPRLSWNATLCVAGSMVVFLLYAPWLVADTQAVPKGWSFNESWQIELPRWILFQLLEWGVLAMLVPRSFGNSEFRIAVIVLFVLPLFKFGVNNDLVMRASILPLIILFYSIAQALLQAMGGRRTVRRLLIQIILLAGAVTPAQEFIRALMAPRWQPDFQANLLQAAKGFPAHYVARWEEMPVNIQKLFAQPDNLEQGSLSGRGGDEGHLAP